MPQTEALVIGGGPGGYVAAIKLGQLGIQTTLVERDRLGGICVNVGCIPSKALIRLARLKKRIEAAQALGIETTGLRVDMTKLQAFKKRVVDRLVEGTEYLCRANKVSVVKGQARFSGPHTVDVESGRSKETYTAKNIIIATGSRSFEIPSLPFDGEHIITSTEALELTEIPANLVVIGGGVTGLEIGTMYAQFGSRVTVIELLDQLLPGMDVELVRVLERALKKIGVTSYVKAKAKAFKNGEVTAELSDGKEITVEADKVLVTVGRRPNSDQIGLASTGVAVDERGFIKVDKQQKTNVEGIYAIGDVTGPPLLAHKGSKEGIVAAEVIAGRKASADFRAIANVVYTDPEIATVGMGENQARAAGYDPAVGKFPFTALGRAVLAGETDGFVKIIADRESEVVLGVHIVGAEVADMISEAALAIEMGATLEDIGFTIHPHPTLPEAMMEAAEAAKGKAIHFVRV
jgi:dihydrolipoamide dehydrogenase